MIELKNIEVVKSGEKLLSEFNFSIKKDEHWVVSGPNGSGKTLLMQIIEGSIPICGEVKYDFITGKSWEERYQQRKDNILHIPAHALQTFLSGHHELFYQQRYYSMGDERIPLVKDLFGIEIKKLRSLSLPGNFHIENLLELELTKLSNGQLKKVLILKQLVRKLPKILLFDYPFEGLDKESREELIVFLDYLADAHDIQLIIVDHHHHLPKKINRRLVLNKFKIELIESVEQTEGVEVGSLPNQASATGSNPVVEMKNVTIQYGTKIVINNLNWTINKGDRWALVGKNGSGKTTLFSLIYADHPMAYSQKVYLFGKRRGTGESIWDIKNRISYVGPELMSYLNPSRLSLPARAYILEQKKDKADELEKLLHFFNAENFIEKPLMQLSSGQLQLMILLMCFLDDKELLLLDEPFQFLDPLQKQLVNEYLQRYLNKDITLVLITHYKEDIKHWTEKTLII